MDQVHTASPGGEPENSAGGHPETPSPFTGGGECWLSAFSQVVDSALVATDMQLRVVDWPPAAEALLGWPASRTVGYGLGSVLSLSRETVAALRDAVDAGHSVGEVLLPARRQGGARCRLLARLRVVRDAGGFPLGIAWALRAETSACNGRAMADLALDRWAVALGALPFPFALVDAVGTVRLANDMARDLFAMEAGSSCCSHLCSAAGSTCRTHRATRSAMPSYWEVDVGGRRLEMSAIPVALLDDQPDYVACFGLPSEPHLSGELRKFFRAVDENLVGVAITDIDGYIEYANPRACDILGSSPVEMVSRQIQSFYAPPHHSPGNPTTPELAQGTVEVQVARPDGETRPVRVAVTDIAGEDGTISNWVILIDDMSERRALEARERELSEQVAHSARLAAVGEIASMIAHEINQPLSSIANFGKGLLHRIRLGTVEEKALKDSLEEIVRQVERAGSVVRNVRRLSRRRSATTTWVDLNRLVDDFMPTCYLLAQGTGVRIVTDTDADLAAIRADRGQIEQVLLNLVRNAIEASADLRAGQRVVIIRTRQLPERSACIEVEDRAAMPPPEILSRLGEPFFSTKPEGLGLGLSISRTLLENHGSQLNVRPLGDRGKVFHFELSTSDEPN